MKHNHQLDPELKSTFEQIKHQEPSEAQYQKMESHLFDAIEQHSTSANENGQESQVNGLFNSFLEILQTLLQPKRLLAGGLAGLAFVATSFILFTSNTQPAFAQVVSTMQSISSMQYEAEMIANGQPLMSLKVFYQAPDKVRVETMPIGQSNEQHQGQGKMINIVQPELGQGLILIPDQSMAVPFNFKAGEEKTSIQDNPLQWFELAKEFKGQATELGSDIINQQQVNGYQITQDGIVITIWANSETNIPVRFSMSSELNNPQPVFTMQADLVLNQTLDPSLFDLTIPSGYSQANQDED